MKLFEEWVKDTKEYYNKMNSEKLLDEFISLKENINYGCDTKTDREKYNIVKFIILERLHYFDCGDDDINYT